MFEGELMRPFIIAAVTLALAACASPPPSPALTTVSAADPDTPVCHSEIPTGSILPRTVCVNRASDAANKRAVTDLQDQVQHSPAVRAGTTTAN
jgi:hypothetical protein